jgi:hypothetical protein
VTGTFTTINDLIDKAGKNKTLTQLVLDVFRHCESVVTDERYGMLEWAKWFDDEDEAIKNASPDTCTDWEIWDLYFSEVHDLDHATTHRAFLGSGYIIIDQLELLLSLDNGLKKYKFKTLFRESMAAVDYFAKHYKHIGHGLWALKGETKE